MSPLPWTVCKRPTEKQKPRRMSQPESWRVALVGSGRVGKTTFAQQWALDYGIERQTEWGIEHRKLVFADKVPSIVYLLDSRPLNSRTNRSSLTQHPHAYLLIYSISNRSTFEAIPNLKAFIQHTTSDSKAAYILIGNQDTDFLAKPIFPLSPSAGVDKDGNTRPEYYEQIRDSFETIADSDNFSQETLVVTEPGREVSTEEGSALAQQLGCSAFLEISTLLREDVEKTIQHTIRHLRTIETGSPSTPEISWFRGVCGKILGGWKEWMEKSGHIKD